MADQLAGGPLQLALQQEHVGSLAWQTGWQGEASELPSLLPLRRCCSCCRSFCAAAAAAAATRTSTHAVPCLPVCAVQDLKDHFGTVGRVVFADVLREDGPGSRSKVGVACLAGSRGDALQLQAKRCARGGTRGCWPTLPWAASLAFRVQCLNKLMLRATQGCGIVEFESPDGAAAAILQLHDTELGGRKIWVRSEACLVQPLSQPTSQSVSLVSYTRPRGGGCARLLLLPGGLPAGCGCQALCLHDKLMAVMHML